MAASAMGDTLERLLRTAFRQDPESVRKTVDPLFNTYGPLSTFAARIQVAFAMGIITPRMRHQLDLIRRMRNDFAHDWDAADFDHPRCANHVKELLFKNAEPWDAKLDETRHPFGDQFVTKVQMQRRMLFLSFIARLEGWMLAIQDAITEGQDPRRIVRDMEKRDAREFDSSKSGSA